MILPLVSSSSIRSSSARSEGSKSSYSSPKPSVEELEPVKGSAGIDGDMGMSAPVPGKDSSSTEAVFAPEGPAKIRVQSTPEISAKSSGILSNSSADIIQSRLKQRRNGAKTELRTQVMCRWPSLTVLKIYSDYSRCKKKRGQFRILRKQKKILAHALQCKSFSRNFAALSRVIPSFHIHNFYSSKMSYKKKVHCTCNGGTQMKNETYHTIFLTWISWILSRTKIDQFKSLAHVPLPAMDCLGAVRGYDCSSFIVQLWFILSKLF